MALELREGVVSVATCYRCARRLPVEEFARDATKRLGRKGICKACDNAKSRRYYAAHRDEVLARVKRGPREAACASCGRTFTATNGRQRYCTPECRPVRDSGATVTVACEWCGREFEARARDRKRGGCRYCGRSCSLQDLPNRRRLAA
jgi:hypothetical protein